MILGLFRRKPKATESGATLCACQASGVTPKESPFEEMKRLTGPYVHENVSLARCKTCGSTALYYSADVYDDFWQYWCTIDEAERAQLLEEDDDPDEPQRAIRARAILERHAYLVRGPVLGFEWVPPGHSVIEGPPW